mmetsp:Transcript_105417/g.335587  ORF Transcript_105417/g.335587 Transcript_105417/m.335587 type:complete len:237 (-) Transcript_105417:238-948(-)
MPLGPRTASGTGLRRQPATSTAALASECAYPRAASASSPPLEAASSMPCLMSWAAPLTAGGSRKRASRRASTGAPRQRIKQQANAGRSAPGSSMASSALALTTARVAECTSAKAITCARVSSGRPSTMNGWLPPEVSCLRAAANTARAVPRLAGSAAASPLALLTRGMRRGMAATVPTEAKASARRQRAVPVTRRAAKGEAASPARAARGAMGRSTHTPRRSSRTSRRQREGRSVS